MYLNYSSTIIEISISFIFICFLIVFIYFSYWFDSKYLFKAPTFPPLIDLRIISLTYLSLKVLISRLFLYSPKQVHPKLASVKKS